MDIVICLASKDYKIVKKVIRECNRYLLQSSADTIYIITNNQNNRFFSHRWREKFHVRLLDEDALVEGLSFGSVRHALMEHFSGGGEYLYRLVFPAVLENRFRLVGICQGRVSYMGQRYDTAA